MPAEKSCGAVLYTEINGIRHYVLVVNDNGGNCTLPKGHVEEGETEKQTALREVFEETNVHAELIDGFRRQVEYIMPNGRLKQIIYFTARYENQTALINPDEHDEILVLPFEEALAVISWGYAKEVLCEAERFLNEKKGWH